MLVDRIRIIENLVEISRHPKCVVQMNRFEVVCAFIDGYDMAMMRGCLIGFKEWMIIHGGSVKDAGRMEAHDWCGVLRCITFPQKNTSSDLSQEESEVALKALSINLENYLEFMRGNSPESLFVRYQRWVEAAD